MPTESKNWFGFLGDKFSELVLTIVSLVVVVFFLSLGCRQLGNFTPLITLLGMVSNGQNARQLEMFIRMPLKGSFKLLKSIRCLLRNVKRFQKLIVFLWINSPSLCITNPLTIHRLKAMLIHYDYNNSADFLLKCWWLEGSLGIFCRLINSSKY